MKVKCLESFQNCLTESKIYDVLAIDGQYILIREDNGRLVWNWIGIFQKIALREPPNIKMRTNWEVL